MNKSNNYNLKNIAKKEKKIEIVKRKILSLDFKKDSVSALDLIFEYNGPATLIQSFSDQDLYFLMQTIGKDDFIPVLALASSEQWEYILDMDVWEKDRINLPELAKNLDILFKADRKRLIRWLVKEKPDFLEYFFSKIITIKIREHDQDPSDFGDGYTTIDDVFYIKFPEFSQPSIEDNQSNLTSQSKELEEIYSLSQTLITKIFNTVADMDLKVYQSILLETCSILPLEVEEEQFRLKNVRLAEKGFLPFYEAVGIYQPIKFKDVTPKISVKFPKKFFDDDLPVAPEYYSSMFLEKKFLNKSFFVKSLSLLNDNLISDIELEFTFLVNLIISADKKKIHKKKDFKNIIEKACGYLSIGMEVICGLSNSTLVNYENGKKIIEKYKLKDIFRIGYGKSLKLKLKTKNWYFTSWVYNKELPLSFLGEKKMGVAGGLLLDKPLYFDDYKTGVFYRDFQCLYDIKKTLQKLEQIIEIDELLKIINPNIELIKVEFLNYKNLILTMWAQHRITLKSLAEPIAIDIFKPFFEELFNTNKDKNKKIDDIKRNDIFLWLVKEFNINEKKITQNIKLIFKNLFNELENEYSMVKLENLDSKLVTHFFLK
ncbi:MAG: hypothetical protein B6I26_03835 [Desulfobacteraceae bacterium 4572_130]|nr:MAG: hypothetical protein B6I26_03835 [Desulfobacteraceae bacterium 4572_130]